ncbi:hypothetical protein [Mobilibacterium timonense]|uniref:sensor histidine kinase n=1 Tax=Mobilibacterium timonense TaxID=1871012 RepID=UPI003A90D3CE
MSPFWQCGYECRFTLVLVSFVLSSGLLYISIRSFACRRPASLRMGNTAFFIFSGAMTTALAQSHFYTFRSGEWGVNIPSGIILVIILMMYVYLGIAAVVDARMSRDSITPASIKETLDNIPVGLCFFDKEGRPVLFNNKMLELSNDMTGSDFQSIGELRAAVEEIGGTGDQEKIFALPLGGTYSYREEPVKTIDGNEYVCGEIFDITELDQKKRELEAQAEDMKEISQRLKYLNDNAYKLAKEKEILAFQTRFHDSMGTGIAAVRHMLSEGLHDDEYEDAIRMWQESVEMVRLDNAMGKPGDMLDDFRRDAQALGVGFTIKGEFPEDPDISDVFITALRTCLTNGIRHGHADEMFGVVSFDCSRIRISISNNGARPDGEVIPGGGITNLMDNVRSMGGSVSIETEPEFCLTVELPVSKNRSCEENI